jgi:UDP-3-O-[3-hydroxymyristoyl] N-acetylglucosamine deacetylase
MIAVMIPMPWRQDIDHRQPMGDDRHRHGSTIALDARAAPMAIYPYQRTIKNPISCSGIGIHSGKPVNLSLKPAPENHGVRFIRSDLPGKPEVKALFNQVVDTSLATVIGHDGCIVSTIEHLMGCLAGFYIDNIRVEIDAYEMPILDGSAAQYARMIRDAGIQEQPVPRCFIVIREAIELKDGDKFVGAYPADCFQLSCTIDYAHPLIRRQTLSMEISENSFGNEIANARTFGFLFEVERLKQMGLAKGGSLENAIVIDDHAVLNPGGLRYSDECVRHKVLDCIGDFSLLGMPIIGHIKVHKSGHAFNLAFLKTLFAKKKSWETSTFIPSKPSDCRQNSLLFDSGSAI